MTSLGVDATDPAEQTAVFVSKANFRDITDPAAPIDLGGNLRLEVHMTDRGEPGTNDEISIQLTNNANALLYSSHWVVNLTEEIYLAAGNIVVHSGFNLGTPVITSAKIERNITPETVPGLFDVKVLGNPTETQFTLLPESSVDHPISVRIMDITGRIMETRNNIRPGQLVSFGSNFKAGTYFAEILQGDRKKMITLVKQ